MTTKKKPAAKGMSMEAFLKASGPGEPLEVLKSRQETDAAWAERAFAGQEPLAPPIRIQRGRPKAGRPKAGRPKAGRPKAGEDAPPTVVKAVRLPVQLLEKLQAKAEASGLSLNALLQMAASEYLAHHRRA